MLGDGFKPQDGGLTRRHKSTLEAEDASKGHRA